MITVYTGGTFDLFHAGHVRFLRRCADIGFVTVSVNTDDFVLRYKGKSPVIKLEDRIAVLDACRWVSRVVVNEGGEDSKVAIEMVKPDVIAVGSDWQTKDYCRQMRFTSEWLKSRNIALIYLPYTDGISSTVIKERMR
jgi:glycerol-3-phosphate cytidylyltransferase